MKGADQNIAYALHPSERQSIPAVGVPVGGHPGASGTQFTLRADGYEAAVASVGASLRLLRYEGRDLVASFDADEIRPAMRGALLAPWPNRTANGRYSYEGYDRQLALNELATGNAAHGFVAWLGFTPRMQASGSLTLAATLEPQPGYPWCLRLDVSFSLSCEGLRQEVVATNLSDATAPFGLGGHPYLLVGDSARDAIDNWTLEVPADQLLLVSEDRLLPTELVNVGEYERGRYDFRRPRELGDVVLNNAYGSIIRDAQGLGRIRIRAPNGDTTELEFDDRVVGAALHCRPPGQ